MDRRSFLKMSAAAGLSLLSPVFNRPAHANRTRYEGPFFLLVHAEGGWDPTYLCDPKGDPINRLYPRSAIGAAGPFRFAPIRYPGDAYTSPYSNEEFFTKHGSRLLAVNGIDVGTGNHLPGVRASWSGTLSEGYPTFGALAASALTPGNPLGFISSGGYEHTAGLVPLTRVRNIDSVFRVAFPERVDPADPVHNIHTRATADRIARAQAERLDAQLAKTTLPGPRAAMSSLHLARDGAEALAALASALPPQTAVDKEPNRLIQQGLVALAAFKSGVAVSANLVYGWFDTHNNHDRDHIPQLGGLLTGLSRLFDEIDAAGLAQKVIVVVGSDFGRGPTYYAGDGKDHWNLTSMLFAGPGIAGNRVVGGTDDSQKARTFNLKTLREESSGSRITIAHIHRSLRVLAGIDDTEPARHYALPVEAIPVFTG